MSSAAQTTTSSQTPTQQTLTLDTLTHDQNNAFKQGQAALNELELSEDAKRLILDLLLNGVRISAPDVHRIWQIANDRVNLIPGLQTNTIWVEEGNSKAGFNHMLKHEGEFAKSGIHGIELIEVVEATTKVGTLAGYQAGTARKEAGNNLGRPIFLIVYKGSPLAVAVSIGSNGFVVGMNRQSWKKNLGSLPLEDVGAWA